MPDGLTQYSGLFEAEVCLRSSILACIPQAIIATDAQGVITLFSSGAERMLGYAPDEMLGKQTLLILHDTAELGVRESSLGEAEAGAGSVFERFAAQIEQDGEQGQIECTYLHKDGSRITVLLAFKITRNELGQITDSLSVATDISNRKWAARALRDSISERERQNSLLNALLKTTPVGVLMVEVPSGKTLIANDAALVLLGRTEMPQAAPEQFSETYAFYKLPERIPYPNDEFPLNRGMQGVCSHVDDLLIVRPDGGERVIEAMGAPVLDEYGRVWASVVSFVDITSRSVITSKLSNLAYYDHLTQLPNRRLFHDRMQVAITQARREGTFLGLLLIDLDAFKPVNDTLGHAAGDLLLQAVSSRMQACVRESDTLARVGGDEFIVILPVIHGEEDALGVAEKIRIELNAPFDLADGARAMISCSIGVAIFPEHGKDEKQLLRSVDEAMYSAKKHSRNCVHLFNGMSDGRQADFHRKPIMRLEWRSAYRCGEASVDQEHRDLFDRANQLIHASMDGETSPEELLRSFDDMINFVAQHFGTEEALLQQLQYEDLVEHKILHQKLVAQALELRKMVLEGKLSQGDLLTFLAYEIVAKHLLQEDIKFFPFVRKAQLRDQVN